MPYRLFMLGLVILWPVLASAQQPTGTALPSLLIPLEPPQALPQSGTTGGYFFNLRPLGADFGRALADDGIYLVGRNLAEELGNVSGGRKQGGLFEGYSEAGFDLDLAKSVGLTGGAVHFQLDDLQGQSFAAYSGSSYLNNRIFAGNGPAFRLQELSYEQTLLDRRVDLRSGRIPAYTQFDGSELYCSFITSLCRTPAGYTFDRGYPPYLAASWATIVQIRIVNAFYANLAIFENEPVLADTSHSGLPGRDWGLNYANGATIPAQLGYRTTIADDRYPRAFSIGGFYRSGLYADPLLNTTGRNLTLFGGKPRMDDGLSEVYAQAQQMVYRPDASDRGLTAFAGANWGTSGQPDVERMVFGGIFYKGMDARRSNDTLGLAVSLVDVNPRLAEHVDSVLSRSTGGQASRSEISYEANYGLAIAPGMSFKPFVEFISHPDQAAVSGPSANNTHAIFVGALFEVDVAHLIGLPSMGQ